MADDPVEGVARAAAQRLAADFGPRLEFEVEAALAERDGPVGAGQYDAVTLGVLVVAIVQLAWSVYDTFRKEHPEPAPEMAERVMRTELRREFEITDASVKITDAVIREITSGKP